MLVAVHHCQADCCKKMAYRAELRPKSDPGLNSQLHTPFTITNRVLSYAKTTERSRTLSFLVEDAKILHKKLWAMSMELGLDAVGPVEYTDGALPICGYKHVLAHENITREEGKGRGGVMRVIL